MIGIPVLDSLSTDELIRVANGERQIRIPEKPPLQLSVSNILEPQLEPIKELYQDKIITLCNMEIESRAGWAWLAKKIQESKDE